MMCRHRHPPYWKFCSLCNYWLLVLQPTNLSGIPIGNKRLMFLHLCLIYKLEKLTDQWFQAKLLPSSPSGNWEVNPPSPLMHLEFNAMLPPMPLEFHSKKPPSPWKFQDASCGRVWIFSWITQFAYTKNLFEPLLFLYLWQFCFFVSLQDCTIHH